MSFDPDRRDILKLMAVGGVVFASGLAGAATGRRRKSDPGAESEFFFLQLSDTHWGYSRRLQPGSRRDLAARDRDDQRASTRSRTSSSSPATSRTRPTTPPSAASA